jgi:asparagine synthase (glutamine-hydrolysing)
LASATRARVRQPLETFTIGFTEPSFDESGHARACAKRFGSLHFEQLLGLDSARGLVPTLLGDVAEPLGDPSIVPTYLLSRFARQRVTVALSGDGGDELFAGYDPLAAIAPAQLYSTVVPGFLHGLFTRLAHGLPISTRNMSFDFKMRRALGALAYPQSMWNPVWLGPLNPEGVASLFANEVDVRHLYDEAIALWESVPGADAYDRTLAFYTEYYLKDGVLTKTDRAAMLNGLETRAPFLDNDLVEFCARLPRRLKYRNGERKYLLRKALARRLPADVLARRKKGFGMPTSQWLREIPLRPPLEPLVGIDLARASDLWQEHRSGVADHRLALWTWWSVQASLPALLSPTPVGPAVAT